MKAMKLATISVLLSLALFAPAIAGDGKNVPLTGNWKGSYVCGQGLTGLTLTINRQSGSTFSGTFHFYPLPANIVVADGCFAVSGRFVSPQRVFIAGSTWIKRPKDYVTVDLDGKIAASGFAMTGGVKTPPKYGNLCSTFELTKDSDKPAAEPSCQQKTAGR